MVKSNCNHTIQSKNFIQNQEKENKAGEIHILVAITRNYDTGRGQKD